MYKLYRTIWYVALCECPRQEERQEELLDLKGTVDSTLVHKHNGQ